MDIYVTVKIETNLRNVFFSNEQENDNFDEWFREQLDKTKFFSFILTSHPYGIPGVSKLYFTPAEFTYKHYIEVHVRVDDGNQEFEELADNEELLDYIESSVPNVIERLNEFAQQIKIPMYEGESFRNMKFSDEEFYCILGSGSKNICNPVGRFFNTPFELFNDYEVFV